MMRNFFAALLILVAIPLAHGKEYGSYEPKSMLHESDTQSGKKYSIDVKYLDQMLNDLALHARNYPPQFDSPQDKERAIQDVKTLSGMLDIFVTAPKPIATHSSGEGTEETEMVSVTSATTSTIASGASSSSSTTQIAALEKQLASLQKQLVNAQKSATTQAGAQKVQLIEEQITQIETKIAQLAAEKTLKASNSTSTSSTKPAAAVSNQKSNVETSSSSTTVGKNVDVYA